ncbi:hypothetical protein [Kineococcus sp. SYSU DK003]|uniref:hypothetical protein n=1 Tax=Kineococcus sp. SYSU DK003 TaxID=3383124 RepID=UPI003D7DDA5A
MTSISATTGASAPWQAQQSRPTPPPREAQGGPLASVSSLLGSSVEDLRAELASGVSLDDIAEERGVSHDDLIAALEAGMPADAPAGVDPTQVLERMAAQAGGPQAPAAPTGQGLGGSVGSRTGITTGSVTDRQQSVVDQLSDLLDTDPDGLIAELQGGSDLLQMLQDRGITRAAAAETVGEGFLLDARA